MTPFSFEWQWNIEYLIFMGLLYVALAIVGCGLVIAYIKTWINIDSKEAPEDGLPSDMASPRSNYSEF